VSHHSAKHRNIWRQGWALFACLVALSSWAASAAARADAKGGGTQSGYSIR
jgi:hypothetical protein